MKERSIAIGVIVVLLGVGIVLGIGPLGGVAGAFGVVDGDAEGSVDNPASTGTVYTEGAGSSGGGSDVGSDAGGDGGSASDTPPFTFAIQQIEQCGQTCRDVTVTLTNQQNTTAEDVAVYTRIYAGNSTAKEDLVWSGQEDVGTMAAGESVTETQRVKLSYMEAYSVKQADGWITVVTTIESADTTITFKSRRDVA